jgi:predicted deacetylase
VPPSARTIAVALHDIEPATFERCALIRDWLDDHGVDRVTLLVIPARDLHPLHERSPEMVDWLVERRRLGDSIAQHGFQHERLRRATWPTRLPAPARARRGAEFAGLDDAETRRAVEAGWRVLKLAGIEPDGFVAPAYAYTPALRRTLRTRFRWWASLFGLHGALTLERPCAYAAAQDPPSSRRRQDPPPAQRPEDPSSAWRRLAPAWSLGAEGLAGRVVSPTLIRAGGLCAGRTLRLDLHPADLEHPRHTLALEWVLRRAGRRRIAATYDELARTELSLLQPPALKTDAPNASTFPSAA